MPILTDPTHRIFYNNYNNSASYILFSVPFNPIYDALTNIVGFPTFTKLASIFLPLNFPYKLNSSIWLPVGNIKDFYPSPGSIKFICIGAWLPGTPYNLKSPFEIGTKF